MLRTIAGIMSQTLVPLQYIIIDMNMILNILILYTFLMTISNFVIPYYTIYNSQKCSTK